VPVFDYDTRCWLVERAGSDSDELAVFTEAGRPGAGQPSLFEAAIQHSVPADYAQAKVRRDELEAAVDKADKVLKALSGGSVIDGRVPDEVRATPEWQAAKRESAAAFAALQRYNSVFVRRFRREMRQDRRNRFQRG
jgi:hypothetical protein